MSTLKELLTLLKEQYPDKASALDGLNEVQRERYLAKLELIAFIELKLKPKLGE